MIVVRLQNRALGRELERDIVDGRPKFEAWIEALGTIFSSVTFDVCDRSRQEDLPVHLRWNTIIGRGTKAILKRMRQWGVTGERLGGINGNCR